MRSPEYANDDLSSAHRLIDSSLNPFLFRPSNPLPATGEGLAESRGSAGCGAAQRLPGDGALPVRRVRGLAVRGHDGLGGRWGDVHAVSGEQYKKGCLTKAIPVQSHARFFLVAESSGPERERE